MELDKIIGTGQTMQQFLRIQKDFPDIEKTLENIYQAYSSKLRENSSENKNIMLTRQAEIAGLFVNSANIYYMSSRLKSKDTLIRKIVNRLYKRRKQYFNITPDNYYKIVTDLIGFKLVHSFPDGWTGIDDMIYNLFYQGDEKYITDYCKEYISTPKSPFLIEKPVVYYPADTDTGLYKAQEERRGRSLYRYEPTRAYSGIHYLINYNGTYTEIQVKSMSSDLWGITEHDLLYKQEASELKDELTNASDLLRILLSASDAVCMYMKEKNRNNIKQAEIYMNTWKLKIKAAAEFNK